MNGTLRFGIVGCGVIGATHAEAITSLPGAQLVAVADTVSANAQQLADNWGKGLSRKAEALWVLQRTILLLSLATASPCRLPI